MRAGLDFPVVDADATHRSLCRGIAEGDHAMIAHRAWEDVAEHHGRPPGAGEGEAEPAAFAGIVEGDGGAAEACVAVLPGVGKRRSRVGAAGGVSLGDIALVEPGREHAARRIDAGDLEALAGRVRRDRARLREARAVARSREVSPAVEVLVLESAEGDDQPALGIDRDTRPRIGPPVEVHGLGRHRDRRGERLAEVGRALHDDAVAGGPYDPERAVRPEGRSGGERFRCAARLAMLMLSRGSGAGQDERCERKQQAHQNLTLMPAIAVSGIPSWGIADALTVDPSNDVSVYPEAKYCTLVRFWILP